MQELLKNWWQLRTSTAIASRENAILMESWLQGYEEYAMEQVGEICRLLRKDWRKVLVSEALFLSGERRESLPLGVCNLKVIKRLYLRKTELSTFPIEISNMHSLEYLFLQDNNLTSIPDEIANLKKLDWLYLSRNPIPELEQERIKSLLPNCEIYF